MVKDKAENRTLQYQQTLVSLGWGHRWCFSHVSGVWWGFMDACVAAAAGYSTVSCVRTGGGDWVLLFTERFTESDSYYEWSFVHFRLVFLLLPLFVLLRSNPSPWSTGVASLTAPSLSQLSLIYLDFPKPCQIHLFSSNKYMQGYLWSIYVWPNESLLGC